MRLYLPALVFSCSEYQVTKGEETSPVVESEPSEPTPEPDIVVSPIFIDFGDQPSDAPPIGAIVTVENLGDDPLTVTDATLAHPSGPYVVTALDETVLLPDETLDLIVEYTPSADGPHHEQLVISSNDPDEPAVPVELQASTTIVETPVDTGTPDLLATPPFHDFGTLSTTEFDSTVFRIGNIGDAALTIDDLVFSTGSAEMALDVRLDTNGALPWVLEPGDLRTINLTYTPTDDVADSAQIVIQSDDPETPTTTLSAVGNGRPFEGFSTGWYIYDDGLDHETTSSPEHPVTAHGDADLYWYEPSGAHGLIDSADPESDFDVMRHYVRAGAGAPTEVSGPLSFSSSSHLSTFAFATYTYVMCDFWIDPSEDPSRFTVSADAVDDGIQVMVNGEILGRMLLGASPTSWNLADVGRPGEVNTLIVILVDDSASHRYLNNLAFYKDGVMVE